MPGQIGHHLNEFLTQFNYWSNRSNWVVELVKLGGNPLRWCLVEIGQIGWKSIEMMPGRIGHHLNEFLPNFITGWMGQIRWKSIEMMPGWLNHPIWPIRPLIKLGRNSLRWCPIRPGMNYWSNWIEIHWDDDSNALTLVKFDLFDQALITGQIG